MTATISNSATSSAPSPTPPLEAHDIVRSFGTTQVLDGVSLRVDAGRIHALLGPNGAGKTTFTKIAAGLLLPDAGRLTIAGTDLLRAPRRARAGIGLVLGGDAGFYGRATARDDLLFFADLAGVPGRERRARVDRALERVALAPHAGSRVRTFSRGMRQRLHLARGILAEPPLLLLDEVTSGLDPEIAREVRILIRELAQTRTGILLTSHLLTEVEALADRVSLLQGGRITVTGSVDAVIAASGVSAITTFTLPSLDEQLRAALAALPDAELRVEPQEAQHQVVLVWRRQPHPQLLDALLPARPVDLVTRGATLEESYLALVARQAAGGEDADA